MNLPSESIAGIAAAPGSRAAVAAKISARERFLRATHCQAVDRPPVWLMRQAGRALPEYRELRRKYSFLELAQTPELAAEVTLQPVRRFHFDAAILFSDILVIPEALGYPYQFKEGGGVFIERRIQLESEVESLPVEAVTERLKYMGDAIRLVRRELGTRTALLGFAGSPWTLLNFMMEQGSAREFQGAKLLFHLNPALFAAWMEQLSDAVIRCLRLQIDAGADAVQLFDSLGGELPPAAFQAASGIWIERVIRGLGGKAPVIVFSKGTHCRWQELGRSGASVVGVDWAMDLGQAARQLPANVAVQGNLDPALLRATPVVVSARTRELLELMRERPGYIFNLGHGVPASAKLENIEALVETVQQA